MSSPEPRPLADDPRELRRRLVLAVLLGPPRALAPVLGRPLPAPPRPGGPR